MVGFTHLHTATGHSVRYGASLPVQLVRRAAERGMDALALTDRDTVTGLLDFARACRRDGIRPIFGVDVAVEGIEPAPAPARTPPPARGGMHVDEPPWRMTLLARDAAGWARLCHLVTGAYQVERLRPVVSWEALRSEGGQGLIALVGPNSEIGRALTAGRGDQAQALLAPWREVFADGLRLEAVWHGRPGTGPGSLRLAARTAGLGARFGVPVVVTNAVRYADADQHRTADVLDSARLLRPIDPRRVDSGQRWLKPPTAMAEVAGQIARAAGLEGASARRLVHEAAATAELCRLDPVDDLGLGRAHLPEPEAVGAKDEADAVRLLRERCETGLRARGLDRDEAAIARLEHELVVVRQLGYESYFLAVAQVVADARDAGIRVAARGSGAGSMVNHALFIATANPLTHHLLSERFISPLRRSLPDIDLDVESARRLEVYRQILARFGEQRVAVTGMPETYRARSAIRATGLALGWDPREVADVAKSFPHLGAAGIRRGLRDLPELRHLADRGPRYELLWEMAESLDGLVQDLSQHPCGVIVSDVRLRDRLPLAPTADQGFPMALGDKHQVEALGLIKLDVLGVRMQSAMAHAVAEIRRATGRAIDLDDPGQVPLDDLFSFLMIQDADTIGLFQLESSGQQDLLSRLRPRTVDDVIADISLFRPGPVKGGMPQAFIDARNGGPVTYPPGLEPVLADTYGVMIWHEQMIQAIDVYTGSGLDVAERARRQLGDEKVRPKIEAWFHEKAAARGFDEAARNGLWSMLEALSSYGFCRAHAVAFAVPALQSAWLKAHEGAALYAGLLEHDPGMWPKRVIANDARRHGVPILPVDVNTSATAYRIEAVGPGRFGVRLSLASVRSITEAEAARIAEAAPYQSLTDLWQRARPSLPVLEHLIEIGALDSVRGQASRRDLLLQAAELHRAARASRAADGQLLLDGSAGRPAPAAGLSEMTSRESLAAEIRAVGIDVSGNLMDHHHRLLRELGALDAAGVQSAPDGANVLVAGVRSATHTPPLASGKRIIFATLDATDGLIDVVFFEDSHERCARVLFRSALLLVRGTVQRRGGRASIVAGLCWDLDQIAAARRDHGPDAALKLLRSAPAPTPPEPSGPLDELDQAAGRIRALGHSSPGSAG